MTKKNSTVTCSTATDWRKLLSEAVDVIEGLADQQAMYDGWYEEPLKRFYKALDERGHEEETS